VGFGEYWHARGERARHRRPDRETRPGQGRTDRTWGEPSRLRPMPAGRLPPGLYERLLSLALDRDIQALDPKCFAAKTEAPEETERPRLLARYIHNLLSLALDAQKGDNAEAKQLDLCRRVLNQLIETDTGLDGTDHLREPAALLTQTHPPRHRRSPRQRPRRARPRPDPPDRDSLRRSHRPAVRRPPTSTAAAPCASSSPPTSGQPSAAPSTSWPTWAPTLHPHRESGFSTAYVGSSNLSHSALLDRDSGAARQVPGHVRDLRPFPSRSRSSTSPGPNASATAATRTWWWPPPGPARPSSPPSTTDAWPRMAGGRGCSSSRTARRS